MADSGGFELDAEVFHGVTDHRRFGELDPVSAPQGRARPWIAPMDEVAVEREQEGGAEGLRHVAHALVLAPQERAPEGRDVALVVEDIGRKARQSRDLLAEPVEFGNLEGQIVAKEMPFGEGPVAQADREVDELEASLPGPEWPGDVLDAGDEMVVAVFLAAVKLETVTGTGILPHGIPLSR